MARSSGRFSKLEKGSGDSFTAKLAPPPGTLAQGETEPAPPAAAQAEPDNYPDFVQEADKAFFTGHYKEALRHYSRALQQDNTQVYPWIGQISCLIEQKQFREANLWSERALDQFPEDPSLLAQRARVLAHTGNLKRAIGVSDYSISKGATEWAWLARGEVLLEAKDGNSMSCFQKAVEMIGKEDWRIPLLAGLAFKRRRQWANAEEFFRLSVEANPRHYYTWYEYAQTLTEMSFLERARDAVTRVRNLKPDFRPAKELELRLNRRPFLKRIFGIIKR